MRGPTDNKDSAEPSHSWHIGVQTTMARKYDSCTHKVQEETGIRAERVTPHGKVGRIPSTNVINNNWTNMHTKAQKVTTIGNKVNLTSGDNLSSHGNYKP